MYKRVVVPLVIRVLPPHVTETLRSALLESVEQNTADAREYLAPLAENLRTRSIRVRTEVRHGEPVDEIVDCARDADTDLIAMTTHGRNGLGRLLFGSVAEAVLRQAEIPVFLMRMTETQVAAGAARPALR